VLGLYLIAYATAVGNSPPTPTPVLGVGLLVYAMSTHRGAESTGGRG